MADHSAKVKDIIEKELGVEREKLTDDALGAVAEQAHRRYGSVRDFSAGPGPLPGDLP